MCGLTLSRWDHKVLPDFVPTRGSAQFIARPLVTAGYADDLVADSARLVPDTVATKTVDDLTATVTYDPATLVVGLYGHMTFHLTKADTRAPVTEMQTYLGAFGHTLIVSEDMVEYVHSHPIERLPADADLEQLRRGPDAMFDGLMPKPGRYRAWTQFRYRDKVHTFPSRSRSSTSDRRYRSVPESMRSGGSPPMIKATKSMQMPMRPGRTL